MDQQVLISRKMENQIWEQASTIRRKRDGDGDEDGDRGGGGGTDCHKEDKSQQNARRNDITLSFHLHMTKQNRPQKARQHMWKALPKTHGRGPSTRENSNPNPAKAMGRGVGCM